MSPKGRNRISLSPISDSDSSGYSKMVNALQKSPKMKKLDKRMKYASLPVKDPVKRSIDVFHKLWKWDMVLKVF